jgi:hypothetical protein
MIPSLPRCVTFLILRDTRHETHSSIHQDIVNTGNTNGNKPNLKANLKSELTRRIIRNYCTPIYEFSADPYVLVYALHAGVHVPFLKTISYAFTRSTYYTTNQSVHIKWELAASLTFCCGCCTVAFVLLNGA